MKSPLKRREKCTEITQSAIKANRGGRKRKRGCPLFLKNIIKMLMPSRTVWRTNQDKNFFDAIKTSNHNSFTTILKLMSVLT